MVESLQIIFEKYTPLLEVREAESSTDPSSDDAGNSTFLRKLVKVMMADNADIAFKQAREIATFFSNIARLTLALEDAP